MEDHTARILSVEIITTGDGVYCSSKCSFRELCKCSLFSCERNDPYRPQVCKTFEYIAMDTRDEMTLREVVKNYLENSKEARYELQSPFGVCMVWSDKPPMNSEDQIQYGGRTVNLYQKSVWKNNWVVVEWSEK